MKTAEEKATEYAERKIPIAYTDETRRIHIEELRQDVRTGYLAGYNEAMRWRDPEVEMPEFNKKDYLNGDYKKYLIRVVEGSISTRIYVTVGWLISANRWNAEMDWVAVVGWRPIE